MFIIIPFYEIIHEIIYLFFLQGREGMRVIDQAFFLEILICKPLVCETTILGTELLRNKLMH